MQLSQFLSTLDADAWFRAQGSVIVRKGPNLNCPKKHCAPKWEES